jgi:hypothetical protein
MLRNAKWGVALTALATAGLFLSTAGVQASTAASSRVSFVVVVTPLAPATLPNTTVSGKPAKFSPTSNTVAPVDYGGSCSSSVAVFTITNDESKTVSFKASINGGKSKAFGKLPKDSEGAVCEEGPAGTYFTYSIKGSTSTFKSTLS